MRRKRARKLKRVRFKELEARNLGGLFSLSSPERVSVFYARKFNRAMFLRGDL